MWVRARLTDGCHAMGFDAPARTLVDAGYFLLIGVAIPWAAMAVLRRGRLRDLGWRAPNRFGWRILVVGYLVAAPFLIWMVNSPGFTQYYMHQLRAGLFGFLCGYFVNMFAEHFLFHGVMLGAFRAGHRWPEPQETPEPRGRGVRRVLQWFGLDQPVGDTGGWHRVEVWVGLPTGCVTAIVITGLLFGIVHLGKDTRELFLSVPGGMASAYLAYRTDSWLTPFALHLATAGTACLLMVFAQP